jgi:hypothetical protein
MESSTARLAGDSIHLGMWMAGPSTITAIITAISAPIFMAGARGHTIAPVGKEVISTEDMDSGAVGVLEAEERVPFMAEASPAGDFMAVGSAEAAMADSEAVGATEAEGDFEESNRELQGDAATFSSLDLNRQRRKKNHSIYKVCRIVLIPQLQLNL